MFREHYGMRVLLCALLVVISVGVIWEEASPLASALQRFGPPCLFHSATGLSCPGCGLTRASIAVLRGEWGQAWQYNYFLPVIILTSLAGGVVQQLHMRRRDEKWWRLRICIVGGMLLLTLLWAVIRNVYGC